MSKVESAMNNNTNVEELDLNIQKKNDNNFDSSEYDTNDKVVERFKKIKTLIISLVREHEFLLKIYKKNCDQEVKKMSGKKKKRILILKMFLNKKNQVLLNQHQFQKEQLYFQIYLKMLLFQELM